MRINALEDQETGFQCGDADDNDEGRYMLFYFFVREIYMAFNERRCWERWINTLEDQETGFNGDVDDNDEVAAYSFIFVRDNFNPFNEETQYI